MKLYWGSHTCAIGIHILLEEIGKPYETEKIDVAAGDTRKPSFLSINPKGKVPTLVRDDGSVLTEFSAIATWLGRTNPQSRLLPDDPDVEARVIETMAYVEGTIHGQGYARIFAPRMFEPQVEHSNPDLWNPAVQKQGREMVEKAFELLDPQLGRQTYAASNEFTVADAALFYTERWAPPLSIALPTGVKAHFDRMLARPSVCKVMALWGEQ